jgi:hypothetical protein
MVSRDPCSVVGEGGGKGNLFGGLKFVVNLCMNE